VRGGDGVGRGPARQHLPDALNRLAIRSIWDGPYRFEPNRKGDLTALNQETNL
jgi:hypothetical protein